jgi:hypothetical protein
LILLRFMCLADTQGRAIEEAAVFPKPFVGRMKGATAKL